MDAERCLHMCQAACQRAARCTLCQAAHMNMMQPQHYDCHDACSSLIVSACAASTCTRPQPPRRGGHVVHPQKTPRLRRVQTATLACPPQQMAHAMQQTTYKCMICNVSASFCTSHFAIRQQETEAGVSRNRTSSSDGTQTSLARGRGLMPAATCSGRSCTLG